MAKHEKHSKQDEGAKARRRAEQGSGGNPGKHAVGARPEHHGAHERPVEQPAEQPARRAALRGPWVTLGLLTGAALFLEVVLAASCGGVMPVALVYQALFSLVCGALLTLAATAPTSGKRRRSLAFGLTLALGIVFCVMYFVFVQFKIFYDLRTVLGGAGGVAGQFGSEAAGLVLTPSGIAHVLLFLAPAVGIRYALGREDLRPARATKVERLRLAGVGVAAFALALALTAIPGAYHNAYWTQYNFNTNVRDFGLMNSLRREVGNLLFGGEVTFQAAERATGSEEAADIDPSINAAGWRVGEPQELDLDLDELADSAESSALRDMDAYVASLAPTHTNEMTGLFYGKNLIFISAEAFCAEAIREDTTPTLYRMATRGIQFTDYYQSESAGTTGGECANIFGLLPLEGGSSVKMTSHYNNWLTMGNALNRLGYHGWAFHNNTYTYYSRDLTHTNLGYSEGYMGYGNGMEEWVTWQWPQSDLEMLEGTFENLYGLDAPFNVYYMSVSGHSNYDPWDNAMSQKWWDEVADLDYSDRVQGYLACQIDLDRAMEYLISRLEELGIADDTVIVIAADHFPYGLDNDAALGNMPYLSELYGYDVNTYFERDHNRLIVWSGSLEEADPKGKHPIVVDTPTSSLDILPTLLNLFGCEWDSRLLPGRDVFSEAEPLVFFPDYSWRTDLGTYYSGRNEFVPAGGVEEDDIPEGYVDEMNTVVANKMSFCRGRIDNDYLRHLFGDPGDVQEVCEEAREEHADLIDAAQAAYATDDEAKSRDKDK